MPVHVLFAARPQQWPLYERPLTEALARTGLDCVLAPDLDPAIVDYMVYAPNGDVQDFSPFGRLKAVLNLWAGVEDVVFNPTLTVPLARMVDEDGLTQGMVEWVTGHVLRHHLGMDAHITNPDRVWNPAAPPLSSDRPVTILGLGHLGTACARALRHLGFPVTGWSRSRKVLAQVECRSGEDGLVKALSGAQIVVLLLPDTPDTKKVLNAETLALLEPGAIVINPGRGALIDDAALLSALDSGQVGHATLDVFRTEPLPPDDPYWAHPRVTVTPHIASETRVSSASRVIAANILRGERGKPLLHLVDRDAGY